MGSVERQDLDIGQDRGNQEERLGKHCRLVL